jgi:hypothetical protein
VKYKTRKQVCHWEEELNPILPNIGLLCLLDLISGFSADILNDPGEKLVSVRKTPSLWVLISEKGWGKMENNHSTINGKSAIIGYYITRHGIRNAEVLKPSQ